MTEGNATRTEEINDHIIDEKICLLGASATGKTSLVMRFMSNIFHSHMESTLGAAFSKKVVRVPGTDPAVYIKFEIWDTAGQERYAKLAPMYYRECQAAIVVYGINDKKSFERSKFWIDQLLRSVETEPMIILTGNKNDLEEERAIQASEAEDFAKQNDCSFIETSAKTGHNVHELFNSIAKELNSKAVKLKVNEESPRYLLRDEDLYRNSGKEKESCC